MNPKVLQVIAAKSARLRFQRRVLLVSVCLMTAVFLSNGVILLTVSESLVRRLTLSLVVMGAGVAVQWCMYAQYLQSAWTIDFVGQIVASMGDVAAAEESETGVIVEERGTERGTGSDLNY